MKIKDFKLTGDWRPLANGEEIKEGDVFECGGNYYCASDYGNGIYDEKNHCPHFREDV